MLAAVNPLIAGDPAGALARGIRGSFGGGATGCAVFAGGVPAVRDGSTPVISPSPDMNDVSFDWYSIELV